MDSTKYIGMDVHRETISIAVMRPSMARLTVARKIAAITLIVWKKGVCFDAEQLKRQGA